MTNPSGETDDQRTERIVAWVQSPEGRQRIQQAFDEAERKLAELHEARRLDWRILQEPMTL